MARKTKADALLTRDCILEAAEVVFRESGVTRTSLEDIARQAGCTRGAVYWHFQSKANVLIAMYDRVTLPLYDSIQRIHERPQVNPFGAWRDHLMASLRAFEADRRQQNICDILMNHCEFSEELQPLKELEVQRRNCFIASTERLLRQAQSAGQIDGTIDVPLVTLGIHAMIHGLIQAWLQQPGQFPLVAAASVHVDVLARGLDVRMVEKPCTPPSHARGRRRILVAEPVAP